MTREKAKEILGVDATEEQITSFLNNFHTIEKEKNDKIQELNDKLSKMGDYEESKRKLQEIEREKLSEQEKIDLLKKETEKNVKESKIILNTAKAKVILAGLDLDDDFISTIVSDDLEKTVANAEKLANKFNVVKEQTVLKTNEEIATLDVKPTITNVDPNNNGMTRDKYTKLSEEEQSKFAQEHPTEFSKL